MNTYARYPLTLERGMGCRLWDVNGVEYLDLFAGIATASLGHAHPILLAAVHEQLAKLHHVSNLYMHAPGQALAEWLVAHSCADQVFFCNSGAEANEGGIKLIRRYSHVQFGEAEPVIIAMINSFHGRTLATATATGQDKYRKGWEPLVAGFEHVPLNDLDALKAKFNAVNATPGRRVAAVLLEPIQGEGGVTLADESYLREVRSLCDAQRALLMFDEIQAGAGRSGKFWCYEWSGVEPDLVTIAKGSAAGIPFGALLSKSHCSAFQPGEHGTTFGGNPLAAHVALTVCRVIHEPTFLAAVHDRGVQMRNALETLVATHPTVYKEVRGRGLLNGLEIRSECSLMANDIVQAGITERVLLVPAGAKVLRFIPPLIITEAEIDEGVARVTRATERALSKSASEKSAMSKS